MSANLLEDYEEYRNAGKKAKTVRNRIMYSSSSTSQRMSYYSGIPTAVVFKIIKSVDKSTGKTNRNTGYGAMKALEYIANDKEELENSSKIKEAAKEKEPTVYLETDDGRILKTKQEIYNFYKEWEDTFTDRKNGKDFEHLLLSTKELPGTSDKQIIDAAREVLRKKFGDEGYNYAFNLHRNTEHVHVHTIMRVHNVTKNKRLDIKKDDIDKVKDTFASELRLRGLNYENYINFNKILGINSQLKYLEQNDLSWFQANMKKFENESIDDLLETIKNIDKSLENLYKQKENSELSREDKQSLNEKISLNHADKKAIIYKLNGLEYGLQQATKNYKGLMKKRDSIEWYLKKTSAYKEIDRKTNEAQEIVIQKKLELNKAQLYIDSTKSELTFSSKIKKDTLYYINNYIKDDSKKDINSLLYKLKTIEKKMPKSTLAKEIKELKKDILDNEYNTAIKSDFIKILNEVKVNNQAISVNDKFTNDFIKSIDKKLDVVINNVKSDKDVSARDIKSIGFDLDAFETFTKVYKVDHIKNTPENLKEFVKFKEYFDEKTYKALVQDLQENKLTDRNLNYALDKAVRSKNIESLPYDLKQSLELEKRDVKVETLNIDSYHKYLNENQSNIKIEPFIKIDAVPINDNTRENVNNIFDTLIQNAHEKKVQVKINDIDLKAISGLEKQYKKKTEFKDKVNQYIKTATNKSESKEYLEAILDMKSLSGMKYMISKGKITEVPKSFLNSRNIDTTNLPIEKVDKKVFTIDINTNTNNNLDSFSQKDYQAIKSQDYKELFKDIESLKFEDLSMEDNKNDFYKLFAVISSAKEAKDIDTLINVYKLDPLSDKNQMIKDFGKALDVNPQDIKKTIWSNYNNQAPAPETWDKTHDFYLETFVDDYKEQFIEEYTNEISMEYLLYISEKTSISQEVAQKSIDEFNKGLEDFKEEYLLNKEYEKNIESIKEHLNYGEFKTAREIIEKSNFDEVDLKIFNSYYDEHIDMFSHQLEDVEEHIYKQNELEQEAYFLDEFTDDHIYKNSSQRQEIANDKEEVIKETEKPLEGPQVKEDSLQAIEKKTKEVTLDKKRKLTHYDKLKEQYDHKKKEFIDKLVLTLNKSINEQKVHDNKDMMFNASKRLSSELKRNINQIEDVKRTIEGLQREYKVEKKHFEDNLHDFSSRAIKTNRLVKEYVEQIDKSELDNKSKLECKLGLYDELAKYRYSERITTAMPEAREIKTDMLERSIEHFKLINKQIAMPKLDKETRKELEDKSSQLLKDFNKLNPSFRQERTITKLHKEQVKLIKQRGMER